MVKEVAEVQGRDEGALADEVDALKEAAAREAAERKALLEIEYERQHDEVALMLERVHALDPKASALPEEALARHAALQEKELAIAAEPRIRRRRASKREGGKGKKGRGEDDEEEHVPLDPARRQEVDAARQAAVEDLEEAKRREKQMLHRQEFEQAKEMHIVRPPGDAASALADPVAQAHYQQQFQQRRGRRFFLIKSLLRRQRLRRIIGRDGGSITRETDRLKNAIGTERGKQRARLESLLTPHVLPGGQHPEGDAEDLSGSDASGAEAEDAAEDRAWLRGRVGAPSPPQGKGKGKGLGVSLGSGGVAVSPRTRRIQGAQGGSPGAGIALGGSGGAAVEVRGGRGAVLVIG